MRGRRFVVGPQCDHEAVTLIDAWLDSRLKNSHRASGFGQPLSKLKSCLQKYPQAQRNLAVKEKRPLAELDSVMKLVTEAEKELSGKGRVLLRYSGTEPKIRLLIEGREFEMIDKQADRIADAIQTAIGAS